MAPEADADDAVAEAYMTAWRRQRDIPPGAELGWMIGVTRRVLANARRSERRVGALRTRIGFQPRFDAPDPAAYVEDGELRAALLELAPLDREAVLLAAWFDLTSADAARALGITPAAYRMRVPVPGGACAAPSPNRRAWSTRNGTRPLDRRPRAPPAGIRPAGRSRRLRPRAARAR